MADKNASNEGSREERAKESLKKGLSYLYKGDPEEAVEFFSEVLMSTNESPLALSCLGLSIARTRKDMKEAERYCKKAIEKNPKIGDFYRSLAEVYKIQGKKAQAIETLNKGLPFDRGDKKIFSEIKKFGIRKKPPISFLPRPHFLNKMIGRMLSKKEKGE